jgi:hypothetical protein
LQRTGFGTSLWEMRSAPRLGIFAMLALLAAAGTARGEDVVFGTDYQPNVVSLWSNVPFPVPTGGASGFNTPGWGVIFNPANPGFIQLVQSAGFGLQPPATTPPNPGWLTYVQSFNGTVTTNSSFQMDWQEVYWNTATNTLVQGFAGRIVSNGGGLLQGTYAATPGLGPTLPGGAPLFIGPTPEPSSMIAFGVGLGVVALSRRRRQRAGQSAIQGLER